MSDTPPVIGQDPWGSDLNAYLASLEARITALEAKPELLYNSFPWSYNAGLPPASTNGQLRFNNIDPQLATLIDFRKIDSDGADRSAIFQQLEDGDRIRVNDWDLHAANYHFVVTGPVVFPDSTNVHVPVVVESGTGPLPTQGQAKCNVAFIVQYTV